MVILHLLGGPIIKGQNYGDIIKIIATDPLAKADFEHYCLQSGFDFLESYNEGEKLIIKYKFKN